MSEENALVVREVIGKKHHDIVDELRSRLIEMLEGQTQVKAYGVNTDWNGDSLETLKLQISDKVSLDITVRSSR